MKCVSKYNQQSILLIPSIVKNYRIQFLFHASKDMIQLIDCVTQVVSEIQNEMEYKELYQELMVVLSNILEAQERKDYSFIADVLEGDLLPILLQLQMQFEDNIMVSFFDRNLSSLQTKDSALSALIGNAGDAERYSVTKSICGLPNLCVNVDGGGLNFHSTINPQWEASEIVHSMDGYYEKYYVYGIGMGYLVKEIFQQNPQAQVVVFEDHIELLKMVLTYQNFELEIKDGRLVFRYDSDITQLAKFFSDIEEDSYFYIHHIMLRLIEDDMVRQQFEDFFLKINSVREQKQLLDYNFLMNQKQNLPECSCLEHSVRGKDAILIAAGPSVDDEMEELMQNRERFVILAVGRVANKLVDYGIYPDFITITDPQEITMSQIQHWDTKQIPLIVLSTAYWGLVKNYKGHVYVAYQKGYAEAEEVAKKQECPLFETGGSVTTFALDFLLRMNARRIFLVGVDMAYTDGVSHATGVGGGKMGDVSEYREVLSTEGNKVYTTKNLDTYRKWIENRIKNIEGVKIYNTGRGAHIEGTIEIKQIGEV